MGGGKYEGQGMMVGHRGEGEHGLLIIRQHGVEEQYSNMSSHLNSPSLGSTHLNAKLSFCLIIIPVQSIKFYFISEGRA